MWFTHRCSPICCAVQTLSNLDELPKKRLMSKQDTWTWAMFTYLASSIQYMRMCKSEWDGDTVPCPCGPSRCTSVHMSFWSHTHLAYPGQDRVASHATPSQMNAHRIHVCCKDEEDKTVNYIPFQVTTLDTRKHHRQAEYSNRRLSTECREPYEVSFSKGSSQDIKLNGQCGLVMALSHSTHFQLVSPVQSQSCYLHERSTDFLKKGLFQLTIGFRLQITL